MLANLITLLTQFITSMLQNKTEYSALHSIIHTLIYLPSAQRLAHIII